nr:peptidoglycan recognition protein family protein [Actinomycetota bacterium]
MTRPEHSAWAISRRRLLGVLGGVSVSGVFLADLLTGDGPDLVATATPLLGPRLPKVLGCRGWQAREPSGPVTVLTGRPDKILVHHTATANQPDPPLSLDELARAIQDNHMDNRGWIDSGQNFLVNRAGLVAEGRHRSLETLLTGRAFIEGAHCTGQNDHSIGIENQGTYTEANPPLALLAALRVLCAFVCLQYRIKPGQIYGHRDFSDTACPGDRLYAQLPSLRGGVARLLVRPAPVPRPAPPVATPDLEARKFGDPSFGNLGAGSLGAGSSGAGSSGAGSLGAGPSGVGSPPTWP